MITEKSKTNEVREYFIQQMFELSKYDTNFIDISQQGISNVLPEAYGSFVILLRKLNIEVNEDDEILINHDYVNENLLKIIDDYDRISLTNIKKSYLASNALKILKSIEYIADKNSTNLESVLSDFNERRK